MTTAFIAVAFFAAAAVLFLFAVTIARAAADIEDVDDGRGFGGDDE